MIGHLISTIIMALGVATGNISSNAYKGGNAFNNELKSQPIKKTAEQEYTYNYTLEVISTYDSATQGISKLYLNDGIQTITTSITSNLYYTIYNTTYIFNHISNVSPETWHRASILSIYRINTYYNTENFDIKIHQRYLCSINTGSANYLYFNHDNFISNTDISEYIDMTLTSSTISTLYTNIIDNNRIKTNRDTATSNMQITNNYIDESFDNEYIIQNITGNQELYVVLKASRTMLTNGDPTNIVATIIPGTISITANALLPTYNYEVVDIPNLMYTIITMPFSFISTAFNLTVFGGTPYALNFGNLFITVIAAFILLWIISKVLKR